MQMQQGDVLTQEADLLHEPFEPTPLKECPKELLMHGGNSLLSLEVGSRHVNVISIFREGGCVSAPIALVPLNYSKTPLDECTPKEAR